MHHHHLHAAAATTSSTGANTPSTSTQATTQRRRKKRPNNGTRTVEVRRGYNGFGFTISGQQPCRLSCIVSNSPAEQAGLRTGDFLISVNGLNVSMLPHETVVQLIGNSFGSIRMEISDHFYLDTSDEENAIGGGGGLSMPSPLRLLNVSGGVSRFRSRHMYHKSKQHRVKNSPQKRLQECLLPLPSTSSSASTTAKKTNRNAADSLKQNTTVQQRDIVPKRTLSEDIQKTVSTPRPSSESFAAHALVRVPLSASLEYRAVVGYMGTIEMPKQIAHSSKLQTVRSCIRKLRQEKRQAPNVLMIIVPDCLKLQSHTGSILATYPSTRLAYVSSSSESENRYFGLVTSTIYTADQDEAELDEEDEEQQQNEAAASMPQQTPLIAAEVSISNSCHVFSVDTKLSDHQQHSKEAEIFRIDCTKDPISNLCLEFPNNSDYVVNLIRSMYTMRTVAPAATQRSISDDPSLHHRQQYANATGGATSQSPQPSNHSEISTTTSNSDSGIGYNNDCSNVTDRIVVVDFPHNQQRPSNNMPTISAHNQMRSSLFASRPQAIFHENAAAALVTKAANTQRSRANTTDSKALAYVAISNKTNLVLSRSCDDVLNLVDQQEDDGTIASQCYASMDDISLHTAAMENADNIEQQFHATAIPQTAMPLASKKHVNLKINVEAAWSSSLQDLSAATPKINSTPDLATAETLQPTSFDRGWTQTSLRTPRADKHTLVFSAPSPNHVQEQKQKQKPANLSRSNSICTPTDTLEAAKITRTSLTKQRSFSVSGDRRPIKPMIRGTQAWGQSFESLLNDPAGLKTFAEFLKMEYAAENIYFWTACERFRNLNCEQQRLLEAQNIFSKHLSSSSLEPVNVDSQARSSVEDNLQLANKDLFQPAQKQIFNLMKFDSYQRFLRSELYKQCVQAEKKGKSLPYSAENLDELLKTTNFSESASTKLKKLASNAEDGRRLKNILPWHRKNRSKSRDKSTESIEEDIAEATKITYPLSMKAPLAAAPTQQSKTASSSSTSKLTSLYGSKSSLSSLDALTAQSIHFLGDSNCFVCRVKFPDNSTTLVQLRSGETVNEMIQRLFEKRGLYYQNFDVLARTNSSSSKTVDLQLPSRELSGKEIEIEQRVAFTLYLPTAKAISVRCKARKFVHEAIRNALERYDINPVAVEVFIRDTQQKPDLTQLVSTVDGQRLQVVYKKMSDYQNDVMIKFIKPSQPEPKKSVAEAIQSTQKVVNEINNKVFLDLMNDKQHSVLMSDNPQSSFDLCSLKSEECTSESSSIFKRIRSRRDSNSIQKLAATKLTKKNLQLSNSSSKFLLQESKSAGNAKLKSPQKSENQDELLEDLNRVQLTRFDDQRGTEINSELPEFLRNNDENTSTKTINDRRPQPAPRLSITKKTKSDTQLLLHKKQIEIVDDIPAAIQNNSNDDVFLLNSNSNSSNNSNREPPPLPPKPKVLPIKPSNWGVSITQVARSQPSTPLTTIASPKLSNANIAAVSATSLSPGPQTTTNARCAYLDEPSSSFV